MTKQYFKITPIDDKAGCVFETEKEFTEALTDWLDSLNEGDELVVKKVTMEAQKFSQLPEYEG